MYVFLPPMLLNEYQKQQRTICRFPFPPRPRHLAQRGSHAGRMDVR
jgi:hypothetical protein